MHIARPQSDIWENAVYYWCVENKRLVCEDGHITHSTKVQQKLAYPLASLVLLAIAAHFNQELMWCECSLCDKMLSTCLQFVLEKVGEVSAKEQ